MNPARSPLLLVVDDEEDLRELIRYHFEKEGFRVLEAAEVATAKRMLQDEAIDLVISDVRMPGGDGTGLLEVAGALSQPIPVILMSGFYLGAEAELLALGAFAVLDKPCSREELLQTAFRALSDRVLTGP